MTLSAAAVHVNDTTQETTHSVSFDYSFRLPPDGFHPRKGNLPCLFSEEATTGFLTALFLALLVTVSCGISELVTCAPRAQIRLQHFTCLRNGKLVEYTLNML